MKKIEKSMGIVLLLAAVLVMGLALSTVKAEAKTKNVVVWAMGATKLEGYKSYMASDYLGDIEWENIIGAGKKQTYTLSKDCRFYLIDYAKEPMENYRVSKKEFKEKLWKQKGKENGRIYYSAMACKLEIKGGMVVKVIQQYQP